MLKKFVFVYLAIYMFSSTLILGVFGKIRLNSNIGGRGNVRKLVIIVKNTCF